MLNADGKSKLGGGSETLEAKKTLITDNINPDLILLQSALNKYFLPLFKGYEDCVIEWDVTELPEMQADMKTLAEGLNLLPLTPNEIRSAFKYESVDLGGRRVVKKKNGKKRIDDISDGVIDNANL